MTGAYKNSQYVEVNIEESNNVEELSNLKGLSIIPNPVEHELTINFKIRHPSKLIYRIISIEGKLIESNELKNLSIGENTFKVNTSKFPSGQYLLSIIEQQNVLSKKFIKL